MTKRICRFGIISDTHIRAPEDVSSSAIAAIEKANSRATYAAKLLALHNPEFTVHLGDMVDPLPDMDTYVSACLEANRIFKPLKKALQTGDSQATPDSQAKPDSQTTTDSRQS